LGVPFRHVGEDFGIHTEFREVLAKSPVWFPLTPALSLGERENPSPRRWHADVSG